MVILQEIIRFQVNHPSRLRHTLTASLQRGKTSPAIKCPGYDIKQSHGEDSAKAIWGMWETPSMSLLPGPL